MAEPVEASAECETAVCGTAKESCAGVDVVLVALAGLLLGALLNLVIIRLPREQGLGGWPRCTRCGQRLRWWQIIPLFGWLLQGGRARCCGRRLDALYPLVDLVTVATLVLLYLQHRLSISMVYSAAVAAVLIVTGAIDWQHRLIYTLPTLGATLAVVLVAFSVPFHSLLNALAGVFAAGVLFVIFYLLARLLFPAHRAPFGLGDVYLGMFIGAALGLTNLPGALLYGMLLAGVFSAILVARQRLGRRDVPQYISYGTFLCIGALIYLLMWGLAGPRPLL
ncbi:MAG: prepilin peptidase [Roseiflexaceae bacterium]|nr:prepilin peptidase [Roseiflexaceae bacterium]